MTTTVRLDTVHVFRDSLGEWRWRRRAPGGRIVDEATRGHRTLAAAKQKLRDEHGYHGYTLMTGEE